MRRRVQGVKRQPSTSAPLERSLHQSLRLRLSSASHTPAPSAAPRSPDRASWVHDCLDAGLARNLHRVVPGEGEEGVGSEHRALRGSEERERRGSQERGRLELNRLPFTLPCFLSSSLFPCWIRISLDLTGPLTWISSADFSMAMRTELTRLGCPDPMPSSRPSLAMVMAFDLTCLTHLLGTKGGGNRR